ncbi:MAG: outer membrane beta-barrel protein [Alphaproteobacteria bacterium]|nr:outer membrane beta-barrel protein [Alphaproteobacteria bacterium]
MKKNFLFLTASLLALGFASQASAADLRTPVYSKAPPMVAAIYDWSGLYIGLNGGGGSSHTDWNGSAHSTGGTIGGQVGYRWQAANWVFGLEAQGNWADFGKSGAWNHVDGFGLFTGQVGYAWNNVLWYAKGGAAVVDNSWNWGQANSQDNTKWGGTIGTGLEIGFAPNWSVGVEYNHVFLGDQDVGNRRNNVNQDIDMGLVRLNYKFGGPVVARY